MKVSASLLLLTTNFMAEEVMLELVQQVASEAEVRRVLAFILLRMETSPITTGSGKKCFQPKNGTLALQTTGFFAMSVRAHAHSRFLQLHLAVACAPPAS